MSTKISEKTDDIKEQSIINKKIYWNNLMRKQTIQELSRIDKLIWLINYSGLSRYMYS